MVLLYGPPGTGKTTLCKSLAQKLSIRMRHQYAQTILVEINSHSLFSKWFSESGKLIQRLFTFIEEYVSDPSTLVCILIDEVESLAMSRSGAISSNEPADSVRAVNALLTQLDKLSRRHNVLLLTTTNITRAIDDAFLDRADMRRFVSFPQTQGRYEVLRSCVTEMLTKGILSPSATFTHTDDTPANSVDGDVTDTVCSFDILRDFLSTAAVRVNARWLRSTKPRSGPALGLEPVAAPVEVPLTALLEYYDGLSAMDLADSTPSEAAVAEQQALLVQWVLLLAVEELLHLLDSDEPSRFITTASIPHIRSRVTSAHVSPLSALANSLLLLSATIISRGMSGRSLRKLPFQAHALGMAADDSVAHPPVNSLEGLLSLALEGELAATVKSRWSLCSCDNDQTRAPLCLLTHYFAEEIFKINEGNAVDMATPVAMPVHSDSNSDSAAADVSGPDSLRIAFPPLPSCPSFACHAEGGGAVPLDVFMYALRFATASRQAD
jgi:nicotinamide riboside kinase